MNELFINDRVNTFHGDGTVVGFRGFDSEGKPISISEIKTKEDQVVIELDEEPSFRYSTRFYNALPSEISKK